LGQSAFGEDAPPTAIDAKDPHRDGPDRETLLASTSLLAQWRSHLPVVQPATSPKRNVASEHRNPVIASVSKNYLMVVKNQSLIIIDEAF
jgi:hypothetical protein